MNKIATLAQAKMIRTRQIRRIRRLAVFIAILMLVISTAVVSRVRAYNDDINYPEGGVYYTSYTVKAGDTLYSIAEEYKWEDISIKGYIRLVKKINNLPDEKILSGSDIIIPYEP